jgi:PAS domain S-box-containing protein
LTDHSTARLQRLEAALARVPDSRRPETAVRSRAELIVSHLAKIKAAVLIANDHGRYVHANTAAARLTGYTRSELVELSVWDLTPVDSERRGRRLWHDFVSQGRQAGTYSLRRKDGRIVDARFVAVANVLPGVHVSLLVRIADRRSRQRASA